MSHKQELQKKIEARTAVCGIIGLGYVGLPLAVELAATGFTVYGIDLNTDKVEAVNRCESYIPDVSNEMVKEGVDSGKLKATTDFSVVKDCDVVSICVPTPLNKTRDPDISYIISALEEGIVPHVHPGMLVIL